MTRANKEAIASEPPQNIIQAYRCLVGALLEHTFLNHEGSELAIGDFQLNDDRAWPILEQKIKAQSGEWDEFRK